MQGAFPATLLGGDGLGSYSFPVPAIPSLAGTWPIQTVMLEPTGLLPLTDTASIKL